MELADLAVAVSLGLLLSVSCGLRAFLGPFLVSAACYAGWVRPDAAWAWMSSPIAFATFGVAVVTEILADKIPTLDHAMDTVHTLLKPAAGALMALAFVHGVDPLVAAVAGLATGGVVAGGLHLTKAGLRVGSTATTGGLGNPFISLAEDVLAIGLASVATFGATLLV